VQPEVKQKSNSRHCNFAVEEAMMCEQSIPQDERSNTDDVYCFNLWSR